MCGQLLIEYRLLTVRIAFASDLAFCLIVVSLSDFVGRSACELREFNCSTVRHFASRAREGEQRMTPKLAEA
jgi:hypothetical protein